MFRKITKEAKGFHTHSSSTAKDFCALFPKKPKTFCALFPKKRLDAVGVDDGDEGLEDDGGTVHGGSGSGGGDAEGEEDPVGGVGVHVGAGEGVERGVEKVGGGDGGDGGTGGGDGGDGHGGKGGEPGGVGVKGDGGGGHVGGGFAGGRVEHLDGEVSSSGGGDGSVEDFKGGGELFVGVGEEGSIGGGLVKHDLVDDHGAGGGGIDLAVGTGSSLSNHVGVGKKVEGGAGNEEVHRVQLVELETVEAAVAAFADGELGGGVEGGTVADVPDVLGKNSGSDGHYIKCRDGVGHGNFCFVVKSKKRNGGSGIKKDWEFCYP